MDLVMTKWIAMEATARLARDRRAELLKRFPAAFLRSAEKMKNRISVAEDMYTVTRLGAESVYPLGEGGVFTALWRLAEELGAGMEVDLRKIPVKQETIEVCEYFDINPYNVQSAGSLLAAAREGAALAEALTREGIPAVVVGRLTDGNDRILWNDGNKRFLDRPQRDEIYKVEEVG